MLAEVKDRWSHDSVDILFKRVPTCVNIEVNIHCLQLRHHPIIPLFFNRLLDPYYVPHTGGRPDVWWVSLRAAIFKAPLLPEKPAPSGKRRHRKKSQRWANKEEIFCVITNQESFQVAIVHYWANQDMVNFAHVYKIHRWGLTHNPVPTN